MANQFLGEIRMVGFNFPPQGWATCDGQLLSISQNTALFSLLGTQYGGDGQTTFALPDLRGRVPVHQGQGPGLSGYLIGEQGGTENVTLTQSQMPAHTHTIVVNDNTTGIAASGSGNYLNSKTESGESVTSGSPPSAPVTLNSAAVNNSGGSQPHTNRQPYLCINFIIALTGIFPSR